MLRKRENIKFRKAVIIGCGLVGSATAFSLMESGLFEELALIDSDYKKAEGEALDISHGVPFSRPIKIYAGNYDEIKDSDIVIITAGANQKDGETRIDLVKKNIQIFKSIIPEIKKRRYQGILLIVANPVDILTYVAAKLSGVSKNKVIGSGTVLDTARLKYEIGRHLDVDSRSVHAFIIGEHGDSEIAVWSSANVSGIPFDPGFVKNRYVGRTFIQPTQEMRERGVRMKLSAVSSIVKGKRVIMIDDSIVRGTTSKRIVKLLKEAGATEVHVRIASPAIKFPCFYGVDISTLEELISHRMNVEELCQFIEADSLAFISMEGLKKSVKHDMDGNCDLCMSCFSGNYVTKLYDSIDRANKDEK